MFLCPHAPQVYPISPAPVVFAHTESRVCAQYTATRRRASSPPPPRRHRCHTACRARRTVTLLRLVLTYLLTYLLTCGEVARMSTPGAAGSRGAATGGAEHGVGRGRGGGAGAQQGGGGRGAKPMQEESSSESEGYIDKSERTQVRVRKVRSVRWKIHTHALTMARLTWEQTAGGTVRTARSTRGNNTGTRAGPNGAIGWTTGRLDPRPGRPTAPGNRVARGGTQGGLNCLTHVLPRCLPTPTEEADGNGYGVITGRGGPSLEAAAQSER